MDQTALFKISYGLYVLTSKDEAGRDSGCITNTVTQVTADPVQIAVAVNKANYTHDLIAKSKAFTASVISEAASFDLFKRFGFQSGRDVDKFAGFPHFRHAANGTAIVTEGTNAYLSGDVTKQIDLGTHSLFLATVSDLGVLADTPSATYNFYQAHIKPRPAAPKHPKGTIIWRCKVCGYEYVGETLPEGFLCPVCKHPASDFERIEIA